MTSTRRFDGYIRVSQTDGREGEAFRSPTQQREQIERWASSNDATVVDWHEDFDVSGSRMDRPGLNGALERIRARQTDGVVVAFLDRFSRAKVSEAMAVYEEVTSLGGSVVATDLPGLDPRDKMGEYHLTTVLAMKRMEWRTAAERWDMSRADAIKDGKAIGGAPFGYRFADPTPRIRGKGVVDSHLVKDGRYAEIVRELFERKVAGATWLELARFMDTAAPKPNGGHWSRNTVRDMIGRRTYLGEVRHGEHVRVGAHEPIVSEALWRRAQGKPGRRTPRGTYLLSGIIRCAACGRRMRGSKLGRDATRVYTCAQADCLERSTAIVARLDAEIVRQFFRHLSDFHVRAVDDSEIVAASADVENRTGDAERLAAVIPSHSTAIAKHQEALAAAESALTEAEDRLHQLTASQAASGPDARSLETDWPTLTLDEQREILRAGVDAVLVRRASRGTGHRPPVRDRVLVLFRGEAPDGVADNGRSGPVTRWAWDDDVRSLVAAA